MSEKEFRTFMVTKLYELEEKRDNELQEIRKSFHEMKEEMYTLRKNQVELLEMKSGDQPAVSIMAMSLDSHVVDCSSHPGPSGLNSHWAFVCVCAQDPKRRREEKRMQCGHFPWGVTSHFLSLCLSGERMKHV